MPDTVPIIHDFAEIREHKSKKIIISAAFIVMAGILSGYLLSGKMGSNALLTGSGKQREVSQTSGTNNNKIYADSTEGQLEAGGINGEGTHKLVRPGGPSQTVYLTSSVLDLNPYENKKVRVWGETFAAQQAGWFMDVGKVEILD